MTLLRDERGDLSTARCAFWLLLVWSLVLVTLTGLGVMSLSSAAYTFLGTAIVAVVSWAAGPRVAQYLGPQLGAVAQALSRARSDREPNLWKDDER